MKAENELLCFMHAFTVLYIAFSASTILLLTFSVISLFHSLSLSILSKAFLKSIKMQYIFFLIAELLL